MASINASTAGVGGIISTADNTGILNIQTAGTTAITVNASQNVGVGVTPSASNTLVKTVQLASGSLYSYSTVDLQLTQNCYYSTGNQWIYNTTAPAERYSLYNGTHTWSNAPSGTAGTAATFTDRMTLDASGNLLVGTVASPVAKVQIEQSSASINGTDIRATSASYTNTVLQLGADRNTSNSTYNMIQATRYGAVTCFIVRDSGNVQNVNNSYGAISDIKLKENIVDATPKLDKLNQVRIVNYNLKTDPNQKQIGVIAQELEAIFPSMVENIKDRDEDGNELDETTKSVKYSVFVPILIKAIQEQQAMINELKAEIDLLKGAK